MQALLNTVWNEPTVLGEISRMELLIRPYSGDLSPAISAVPDVRQRPASADQRGAERGATDISAADHPHPCLARNGKITGSFRASWGTSGAGCRRSKRDLPRHAAMSESRLCAISDVAAGAGRDLTDPNPHLASVTLYFC